MKYLAVPLLLLSLSACHSQSDNEKTISNMELNAVADSISRLMLAYHYNPAELKKDEYLALDQAMHDLAMTAQTKEEFKDGFNTLWKDGPFSHVSLGLSDMKAEDMAAYFDTLRVGERGASLEWKNKTAVLTVHTMMGLDTYERIEEVYQEMATREADALIIDVRNSPGGAFAIIPLVGHVLTDSMDVGMFVSRKWWSQHSEIPRMKDARELKPWKGWSLKSFWHDIQAQPIIRVTFKPLNPHFAGPVYVLISSKSASATEFAVDALARLEQVTLIGETTAGDMLSQKMYDLPYGFQLSLPIAEYYSTRIGKIEGKGVQPDIAIDQRAAMELAMLLISGEQPEEALAKARLALESKDEPTFGEEKIYLFGSMNNWGKKWSNTPQFNYAGQGIYEANTTLIKGDYEFKIAPMDWGFDYGATPNLGNVGVGKKTALVRVAGSDNLRLKIEEDVTLTFKLDVRDEKNAVLLIEEN